MNMNITNAKYVNDYMGDELVAENFAITATIDGVVCSVPVNPSNRHYSEIMRQVEAGTLTIQEAD